MSKVCKPCDQTDLEDIIKKWAMKMFDYTKTKEQGRIPKDALVFNINWKHIKFLHHEPVFPENHYKPPKPKSQILFRTVFKNTTSTEQEYLFRTERTTSSQCEVVMEKCLTIGQEVELKLKVPGSVAEANAGFQRELSVSNAQGDSIEKTLTWGVDSAIKVPSNNKTIAELEVYEDELSGNFEVVSEMAGKIIVSITNSRDNNSLVKVLEGELDSIINPETSGFNKGAGKVISFTNKGSCHFKYAIEQHVTVKQTPLEESFGKN